MRVGIHKELVENEDYELIAWLKINWIKKREMRYEVNSPEVLLKIQHDNALIAVADDKFPMRWLSNL